MGFHSGNYYREPGEKKIIVNKKSPPATIAGEKVLTTPKVKLRDIQLGGRKMFGSRFDVVDGSGKVIAKVFPRDFSEQSKTLDGFSSQDRTNLNLIYQNVEELAKFLKNFNN